MTEVVVDGEVYLAPPLPKLRLPPRDEGNRSPPKRPPSRSSSRYGTPRGGTPRTARPGPTGTSPSRPTAPMIPEEVVEVQLSNPPSKPPSVSMRSMQEASHLDNDSLQFHVIDPALGHPSDRESIQFRGESAAPSQGQSPAPPRPLSIDSEINFRMEDTNRAGTSIQFHEASPSKGASAKGASSVNYYEERSASAASAPVVPPVRLTSKLSNASHTSSHRNGQLSINREDGNERGRRGSAVSSKRGNSSHASSPSHPNDVQTARPTPQKVERQTPGVYDRPWRTGAAAPRKRSSRPKPKEPKPEEASPTTSSGYDKPWLVNTSATPKRKRSTPATAAKRKSTPRGTKSRAAPRPSSNPPTPHERAASTPCDTAHIFSSTTTVEEEPTPTVEEIVAPPPLLSTWEVLENEFQDMSDTVTQQVTLQQLLSVMRQREREVQRLAMKGEVESRTLSRVTGQLYALRDDWVRHTGADLMGNSLLPPRTASAVQTPRGRQSASASAARSRKSSPAYVERLYPQGSTPRQAPDYVEMKRQQRLANPSVLSDEDLTEEERQTNAAALEAWREERDELRRERARLVQQEREMQFHARRGTNIKGLSTVQPTSPRIPQLRNATKHYGAVDADGYDRLAKERVAANAADVALARAKEELRQETAMSRGRRSELKSELDQLKEERRAVRERYGAQVQALRAALARAQELRDSTKAKSGLTPRRRFDTRTLLLEKMKAVEALLADARAKQEEVLSPRRPSQARA